MDPSLSVLTLSPDSDQRQFSPKYYDIRTLSRD